MSHRFGMRQHAALRRRRQMLMLGGGALLLAAFALSLTVIFTNNEAEAHVKAVQAEALDSMLVRTKLLVPLDSVPAGQKISRGMLRELEVSRVEVPEGSLRKEDFSGDLYAKVNLDAGKPLLRETLSQTPLLGNIADLIKPGYRAATLEVDATSGVEGWATAGAHVDIVVTYQDEEDGKKKSQIAIENAIVLSYNRNTERGKDTDPTRSGVQTATVTLSVPTIDAVKIHTARAMGRISLVLRSMGDEKGIGPAVVTPEDFKTGPQPKREIASAKGTVRYTDKNGNERQLELTNNQTWIDGNLN